MTNQKKIKVGFNIIIVLALIVGAILIISSFMHFGDVEFTDNATVKQHITPVNARVSGYIKKIYFKENQQVHKGDTLLVIEDAEFKLHLAQAEAALANAMAGKDAASSSIATTESNLSVNDAGIIEAEAQMNNAKKELDRFEQLLAQDAATQQQYDNVKTAYVAAKARYEQMKRVKASTATVKNTQSHTLAQSQAGINLAKANVDLAKINLSYTVITAPCDGVVGRKDIVEGQLLQPGQVVVNIVDNSELWVVANYLETQLQHIKVGSKVQIKADAVPNEEFEGVVESISDATGSAFSMIPQDNATGNFVKVEQRVPVRISLDGNDKSKLSQLRAGLNVECEIKY